SDGLSTEGLRLIPNYVLEPERHAAEAGGPASRERGLLLYAGQLSSRKRVDLLIDAVALLARAGRRVMLEIRGDGPERAALEVRAANLGAPVWFGSRIRHVELLDRMRTCWAFVQASSLEGHPKTLLEAMSTGAAVVACEAPGVSDCDAIERERTALLARPDAASVAGQVARLLDDPGLCARIGTAAAERVRWACSLGAVLDLERAAHNEAIERAIARANGRGAVARACDAGESIRVAVVSEPPPVRWDPALLTAPRADVVRCWERSLNGFAKRLEPRKRAEFLAELDTYVYSMQGEAAIAAGNGIHPKHDLIRYHDYFVERVNAGERVLDLGCGIGALAASIAGRSGARVTGVDWSEKNLERARQYMERAGGAGAVELVRGDITSDRAPGRFDVVVLSNVLEHIAERPARLRQWSEWYGSPRFLIRVPAFDREWRVPWKKAMGVEWRLDLTHETEYTMEQLERELREAGLTLDSVTTRWGEYYAQARAA
ncbi:MAG: glycosyltransferase, partial [Phycisphaerales bacterium]|nr:glycosyltransferase [Phycisphaerales bacterium]